MAEDFSAAVFQLVEIVAEHWSADRLPTYPGADSSRASSGAARAHRRFYADRLAPIFQHQREDRIWDHSEVDSPMVAVAWTSWPTPRPSLADTDTFRSRSGRRDQDLRSCAGRRIDCALHAACRCLPRQGDPVARR